jgi:hypothetical protein
MLSSVIVVAISVQTRPLHFAASEWIQCPMNAVTEN